MKTGQWMISIFYEVSRLTLGLIQHPYRTVQEIVREELFSWVILAPTLSLAILTLFWRLVVVPLVRFFITCQSVPTVCTGLHFLATWVVVYCVLWQILLLYLLFRFRWVQHQVQ